MHREAHYWYSDRLRRDMGVVVHGHYGPPMIAFPTTGGDEWEYERQGVIDAMSGAINAGRVKVFCVNTNHRDSFGNNGAHPRHRSYMQAQYDQYIAQEVFPFIRAHCGSHDVGIWTMGASLGGYHAVNTLLKHPDAVKRCFALSGVYDMKQFMLGDYDDNFYFNNPVDYMANMSDEWTLHHLASCDIHIATGTGPWEHPEEAYRLSGILASRGVRHSLDDWGPQGGHDWPYWRHMMWEYMNYV
ncbi:MAG TPA: alpha/beta hydrolase-fold protein [Vicinamibacterales bacterium]|nr:alpha/beta hydrolase-fold protein [Vicinamibacterales bacterium]